MSYAVKLDNFEGPLDLLLHLIRKNEMDICDIPIAEITAQYLAVIDTMQQLNLDVAGEFLVMAATLLQIKSRLLLPQPEEESPEEEEVDPRAELVRRLLEYQKYKGAAEEFDTLPQLERDVFVRRQPAAERPEQEELEAIGIFQLVEALRELLREHPEEAFHEVDVERLSVAERVQEILARLEGRDSLTFGELFGDRPGRGEVVVTFLALLELTRMQVLRLLQNSRLGTIWLFPATLDAAVLTDEASLGYQ